LKELNIKDAVPRQQMQKNIYIFNNCTVSFIMLVGYSSVQHLT